MTHTLLKVSPTRKVLLRVGAQQRFQGFFLHAIGLAAPGVWQGHGFKCSIFDPAADGGAINAEELGNLTDGEESVVLIGIIVSRHGKISFYLVVFILFHRS